jgi:hypothetical protein
MVIGSNTAIDVVAETRQHGSDAGLAMRFE